MFKKLLQPTFTLTNPLWWVVGYGVVLPYRKVKAKYTKAPEKVPNPCGCGKELGDNLWGFCSPECLATHYKENE